ncbi:MAG TPA: FkbM family methyltransferase [Thermodesulfobacteriota bacterium]|nr:FkbM family methyltransferase [Thermodesulfobacteriota bacterium]
MPGFGKTVMSKAASYAMSVLKMTIKRFIPEKHRYFIEWHIKHYGVRSARKEYAKLLLKSILLEHPAVKVKVPDSDTYLLLRPARPDLDTFHYIFIKHEYDFDCKSAGYIIDAGAHVGLASVFFSLKYPEAKILSIEPEDSNYKLLVANTKLFPNIKTIKAALWGHKTFVNILNPDAADWEYRVSDIDNKDGISAITVEDAMSQMATDRIDILKMDIEGSEIEVFKTSGSWIDRIKSIVLETHDRLRPGCAQAMEMAIEGRNFDRKSLDGNVLLTQKNQGF